MAWPKSARQSVKAYWSKMTPVQRSREVKRRMRLGKQRQSAEHARAAKTNGKHKPGKAYSCDRCGETFSNHQQKANHVRYSHPKRGVNHASRNGTQAGDTLSTSTHENHIVYLFGKVETLIEYYAHSNGLPVTTLADGVAGLLRHQKGREILGIESHLSYM